MPKLLLLITLIVVVAVAGASYYQFLPVNPLNPRQQEVKVRLAWLAQGQFAGLFVAEEKGFYRSKGLKVELKEYEAGNDQIKELVEGKVDFSIMSAVEFVKGASNGEKIKAVAVFYQDSPYAFASLKSAGINTPADFKGKTLGNTGGNDQARTTYEALMLNHGLNKDDAVIKDVGFENMFDFDGGSVDTIDIYRTDQAFQMRRKGMDINMLYPERFGFFQYGDVLVTTDKLIEENPELIHNFVHAVLDGWEYAVKNQDEAVEILLKYDNKEYHDKDYEAFILKESAPLVKPTGGKMIGSMDYVNWKKTYEVLRNSKVIDKEFDISHYYTTSFLNSPEN